MVQLVAALAAGALLLAACGDSGDSQLPPVDETTRTGPAVAGACAPGEPDCEDTAVVGDEPGTLPSAGEPGDGDDPATVSGGMIVGGGLTISQALSTDATGVLAVAGFIVDDGVDARLCEALAESFPPQCAGAFVPIVDYDQLDLGPLTSAQGIIWTEGTVVVFGELIDGALVADPNVAG